MLHYTSSIEELSQHIFYPIAERKAKQILHDLGIAHIIKDNILINDDRHGSKTTSSAGNTAKLRSTRFVCNMTYDLDPAANDEDLTSRGSQYADFGTHILRRKPVFASTDPMIKLRTNTAPCELKMECSLEFKDASFAEKIYGRFFNLYGRNDNRRMTEVYYNYRMPSDIKVILFKLYSLFKSETDPSFLDYIKTSSPTLDVTVDRDTTHHEIVFEVNQKKVRESISMNNQKPEGEGEQASSDIFKIEFSYSLRMTRPTSIHMTYPIVIKNQLIPSDLVPNKAYNESQYSYLLDDYSSDLYHELVTAFDNNYPVVFPWYDQWKLPTNVPNKKEKFIPFFQGLVLIDEGDGVETTTIDFKDPLSTNISFSDKIIETLIEQGGESFFPESNITLYVFANDMLIEPNTMTFEDGVLTIHNRDLSKTYRVVFMQNKKELNYGFSQCFRILIADYIVE